MKFASLRAKGISRTLIFIFIYSCLLPGFALAVTLNLQVGASTDDATETGVAVGANRTWTSTNGTANTNGILLDPGRHASGDGLNESGGARFTNVTVAQGTIITSAIFTMTSTETYNASPDTVALHVSAQDSDNAGTFSTTGGMLNATNRPRTTAECGIWDITSLSADVAYTVDVTACVQEVIDRVGWSSGNAIAILLDTHSSTDGTQWQEFYTYDNNPSLAPELDITYSDGGGATSVKLKVRRGVKFRGGARLR